MWILYAVLSALFAALTAILAKIGIENVNSNLATAIRTVVVLIMAWGIVFITGKQNEIVNVGQKSWIFLDGSGICDFKRANQREIYHRRVVDNYRGINYCVVV